MTIDKGVFVPEMRTPKNFERWFELILEEPSSETQRPVLSGFDEPLPIIGELWFAAGAPETKNHSAKPAKLIFAGIKGSWDFRVYMRGPSTQIGQHRIQLTTACVIRLPSLYEVLPAGTSLELQVTPL